MLEFVSAEPFTALQEKISLKSKEKAREGEGNYTYSVRLLIFLIKLAIHGIFQARVLEWGAIAFSRNSTSERKIVK